MTRELTPNDYNSTRIIGFSVTNQWYPYFRAALPGVGLDPAKFEMLWYSGGSVDIYANPSSQAWDGSAGSSQGNLQDATGWPGGPDRVIFNVSGLGAIANDPVNGGARPQLVDPFGTGGARIPGDTTGYPPGGYSNNVSIWRSYIALVIANIRSRYPNVRMIYLQPNIPGPNWARCASQTATSADPGYDNSGSGSGPWSAPYGVVRCTYTNHYIQTAINSLCTANVRVGCSTYTAACADFSDWAGHFDGTTNGTSAVAARTAAGNAYAAWYASNL